MKNLIVGLSILLLIFLTGCAGVSSEIPAPPPNQAPTSERYYCTLPESDNGKSWFMDNGSRVCYDTKAYKLNVTILGETTSNQTVNGSVSMVNGYGGGRIWTDGKGVIRVKINSIFPEPDFSWGNWIDTTLPYVLKTSDLGFLGLPEGAEVNAVCNHDVEALSPVFNGQTFTADRITHELDNCRLVTKNYIQP